MLKALLIFYCQAELVEAQQSIENDLHFNRLNVMFLHYAKTIINILLSG